MIYIRDDDVLKVSKGWKGRRNEPYRFAQIHRYCLETPRFMHVPTLLIKGKPDDPSDTGLVDYPETIQYIREETAAGRMDPQIHCLYHIDYGKLPEAEVRDHLEFCKKWMEDNIGVTPTRWYTPWGANTKLLTKAALDCGLKLVDCSNLAPLNEVLSLVIQTGHLDIIEEREVFMHWWERGIRLRKLASIYKFGSIEESKHEEPDLWK